MKKSSIAFIVILVSFIMGFYLWTAILARKKSDELLARFQTIDHSLQSSIDSANNSTGIDAAEQLYPVTLLKSQSFLLIDSLKENLENNPESSKPFKISSQSKSDLIRLLNYIQQINKLKWDMVDSKTPDTINYSIDAGKFSKKKWLLNFEEEAKEQIITYLIFLQNEIHRQ